MDDDFLDRVDWSEHSRAAIKSDDMRNVERLLDQFKNFIKTNEFFVEILTGKTDDRAVEKLAKVDKENAAYAAAAKLLSDYIEERPKLLAQASQNFTAGQRVEVTVEVTCGEDDVLVGTQGTITPTDAAPWPTPPEGKIGVTFDATIFGFEVDEDDDDTKTLCFYIPKYALKEI